MACISIPTAVALTIVIVAANVVRYWRYLPIRRAPRMVALPPVRRPPLLAWDR